MYTRNLRLEVRQKLGRSLSPLFISLTFLLALLGLTSIQVDHTQAQGLEGDGAVVGLVTSWARPEEFIVPISRTAGGSGKVDVTVQNNSITRTIEVRVLVTVDPLPSQCSDFTHPPDKFVGLKPGNKRTIHFKLHIRCHGDVPTGVYAVAVNATAEVTVGGPDPNLANNTTFVGRFITIQ